MHGNTTRLEPTDSSSPSDSGRVRSGQKDWVVDYEAAQEIAEQFEAIGEYKAAREVNDACARIASRAASEGERRGEGVHGQDPPKAEVASPDIRYDSNAGDPVWR